MYNALTIDVEEYFQVENFTGIVSRESWDSRESRLAFQLDKILAILEEADVKATFFVLGWIAERHKESVLKIQKAGHEVASHGYGHQLIYTQKPEEFREDLRKSKAILEDIVKQSVFGYRAPSFSIAEKSMWAMDVLMEEGFAYDSSIFPIHRDRGGVPGGERRPYKISKEGSCLWEFPISTVRMLNQNIPFSGGGYFRLLPYGLISSSMKSVNSEGVPVILYLHPWEFDPDQPRIKAGVVAKFRHYVNIARTEKKLEKLLEGFKFKTMGELLAMQPNLS